MTDKFFHDQGRQTSSTSIGINGLYPSTDSIIINSTKSIYSPIGSPVTNNMQTLVSPNFNSYSNRSNFSSFDKETISNVKYLLDDDDELTRDFERIRLSPNLGIYQNHNRFQQGSSGPDSPLLKQRSLPSHLLNTQQFSNKGQNQYGYNQQLTPTHQTYLNVSTSSNVSPRQTSPNNSDRSFNIWDEDNKEWFDQFDMEMEHHTSNFRNEPSNGQFELKVPTIQNIERSFMHSDDSHNSGNINNRNPSSPLSPQPKSYQSSFLSSTSSPMYSPKSNFKQTSKSVNNSPTINLKHSSRIISVQKANLFSLDSLIPHFEFFGEIRSTSKLNNMFLISYYDLRHSQAAMQSLQGISFKDSNLELGFYFLREFVNLEESNQGTLVIFNLDQDVSSNQLLKIFGVYGEVREIRESPNKKHKFVEFYDVREAEMAMKQLNKTDVRGKKIKIEPSRPGGNKSDMMRERKEYSNYSNSAPSYPHSPLSVKLNGLYADGDDGHSPNGTPISSPRSRNKMKIITSQKGSPKSIGNDFHDKKSYYDDFEKTSYDQNKYSLSMSKIMSKFDTRTTLMIKNIPNKYDQDMLLTAVNKKNNGLYDFFYLPIDFKNKCNVGYAFINFIDSFSIPGFYEEFNNNKWEKFNSEKVCQISYARIQGRDAMVDHFKNSSLLFEDPKCQPLIFQSNGMGNYERIPIGTNTRVRTKKETGGSLKIKLKK